jgi:uncharacterized membrane protein YidH (DUF202 family)
LRFPTTPVATHAESWEEIDMSEKRESSGLGLAVLGVLAVALCCGAPLIAASGVLAALAGIGLGSWLLILAGVALAGLGGLRWYRRRTTCEVPTSRRHDEDREQVD